jgi:putative spermidine/putrescine transport system substrate-binding protein
MTDPTKTKNVLSTGRRRLIAAAGLASPIFFIRNGWAAGKSMYVGTYTGVQG